MNPVVSVLMAGGFGTRLWPWSRKGRPKQFLPLLGSESLIRMTADRILPLSAPDRLLVLTNDSLVAAARNELPEVPEGNLIGESRSCNTAPCVALAAALCERRWGEDRVMAVLSADHFVGDVEEFRLCFRSAIETASEEDCLVTIGIPPTRPETGYGYLECEVPYSDVPNNEVVPLLAFREKPDAATAADYVAGGRHLWNMGSFVWKCSTILSEFERLQPETIDRARKAVAKSETEGNAALDEFYADLPDELCDSIDFAVMEKASRVKAVACSVPWDDVGSWNVLRRLRSEELDDSGNLALLPHLGLETRDTLVAGDDPDKGIVVTVGVEGLIVVRTGDAVLIVSEDKLDLIRQVVPALRERDLESFL